eukprot:m.212030 g.212030  ORF g.212030 m.212030 type:complete len:414 (+) comp25872_c0_seq1:31-1272(+)
MADEVPAGAAAAAAAVEPIVPPRGLEYTDTDGTVMEWDGKMQAYFPKLNQSLMAQYQMGYGTNNTWTQHTSPEGHVYYYNATTGESSWTVPAEFQAAMSGGAQPQTVTQLSYEELVEQERIREYGKAGGKAGEEDDTAGPVAKKPKTDKSKQGFFQLDDKNNPHAYVEGLPTENFDVEQFKTFMSKCGIIQENADGEPKIKLYTNDDGELQGDGRCTYLKPESVDLAITLLDQTEIVPGSTVTVSRAKFQPKALPADAPAVAKKVKPKGKGKSDKDAKKRQEKRLLAWHDEDDKPVRKKAVGVVVIKNMFDPKEFDEDATYLNDIRDDLMSECGKLGVVKKVMIFDRHPEGVVSVKFEDVAAAHACIKLMHNRLFGGRRLSADMWDGHTSYKIEESDMEREERLKKWEQHLES